VAIVDRAPAREAPVAVLLGDGLTGVVTVLGAMSSGRPCAPFDAREPEPRLAAMLRVAGPPAIAAAAEPAARARAVAPGVDVMIADEVASTERRCPREAYGAGDAGIIIFTSGSTGTPKGVVLASQSLLLQTVTAREVYAMTSDDRIAQLSPLSYAA